MYELRTPRRSVQIHLYGKGTVVITNSCKILFHQLLIGSMQRQGTEEWWRESHALVVRYNYHFLGLAVFLHNRENLKIFSTNIFGVIAGLDSMMVRSILQMISKYIKGILDIGTTQLPCFWIAEINRLWKVLER